MKFEGEENHFLDKTELYIACIIQKELQLKRDFRYFSVHNWSGGSERCAYVDIDGKTKSAYRNNYDVVMKKIEVSKSCQFKTGEDLDVLNEGPVLCFGTDEHHRTIPVVMALSVYDLTWSTTSNTICEQWLWMEKHGHTFVNQFVTLTGMTGSSISSMLGKKGWRTES